MKKITVLFLTIILAILLTACHSHIWEDATCSAPKTCSDCGETEGEVLPHTWKDATCSAPKTCSVCGEAEGESLPHTWEDATCTAPKTCSVCDETEGESLPHTWEDATCTAPKTCSVCDTTEGEVLPHTLSEANYQTAATCEVCGITEGDPLPAFFDGKNYPMAELDTSYEYTNVAYEDYSITQTNRVTLSNYRVIASDDQHPAKEGYEWRIVDVHFLFSDPTVVYYGYTYGLSSADYYSGVCYNDAMDILNYNGVDYTECDDEYITLWQEWLAYDLASVDISAGFLVPVGYDGLVLIVLNPYDILMDDSAATVDGYEDMAPIFFRMD